MIAYPACEIAPETAERSRPKNARPLSRATVPHFNVLFRDIWRHLTLLDPVLDQSLIWHTHLTSLLPPPIISCLLDKPSQHFR